MKIHILQMLVSEIEMKQSKIDECQKYSEQYSAAVKVINNVILRILFFFSVNIMWNADHFVVFLFTGLWVADYDLQSYGWLPTEISSETPKNAKLIRLHYSRGEDFVWQGNVIFLSLCLKQS